VKVDLDSLPADCTPSSTNVVKHISKTINYCTFPYTADKLNTRLASTVNGALTV